MRILVLAVLSLAATSSAVSAVYLTPPSVSVPDTGGAVTVTVTCSPAQTNWTVSIPPGSGWISVTNGSPGTGNGAVQLSIAPNSGGTNRLAQLTIGESTLTINESANPVAALVTFDRNIIAVGEAGGTATLNLLTNSVPAGTVPVVDVPWISITAAPPTSTGLTFSMQPNAAQTSRVGHVTFGDATAQVFQAPSQAGLQNILFGVVTDRSSGLPLAGAGVFFYGGGYGSATTDANGVYAFTGTSIHSFGGALSGSLYIGRSGYFEAPPASIPDLGSLPSLPEIQNVTLLPGGTMVRGMVTDSVTSVGVAGATVSFSRSPMSTYQGGTATVSVSTATDGTYVIDSSYFNESGLSGNSGGISSNFSANVSFNATNYLGSSKPLNFLTYPQEVDVHLTPPSGPVIQGTVIDRVTGQRIAGAKVFFYGSGYGYATSDSTGTYTFKLSDLHSFGGGLSGELYIETTGYFEAPPISVPDLGSQSSLPVTANVTLKPGGTVIQGTITDNVSGAPISGATISFNRNPMSTFQGGTATVTVTSASNGAYVIDSSYFNESGLTSGFSAYLQVTASLHLAQQPASRSQHTRRPGISHSHRLADQ